MSIASIAHYQIPVHSHVMSNFVSALSDSDQREILDSVLHAADKFQSPPMHSPSSGLATDESDRGSAANATTRPPHITTMKNIRTVDDIHSLLALKASEAATDEVIVSELFENILCEAIRSAEGIVDAATQSIPRCTGAYDLHLGSSKALLGHGDANNNVELKPHAGDDAEKKQQAAVESITSIVVYDADQSGAATEIVEPKMLSTRPASRSESVGLATFVSAAELAEHRKLAKKAKGDNKGTWTRIKRVWSAVGRRSQLHITQ